MQESRCRRTQLLLANTARLPAVGGRVGRTHDLAASVLVAALREALHAHRLRLVGEQVRLDL